MWEVGSTANAFDPDLNETLGSTQQQMLRQNSQAEDAKCCCSVTYTVGQAGQTCRLQNKAMRI